MKATNPNSALWLNCWQCGVSRAPKKLFSGLFLLFCRLLRKDLGELVSVMEHDHGYLMGILYELCESRLCKGIGEEISGERTDDERKNIYDVDY
jgi:hypothetical protein